MKLPQRLTQQQISPHCGCGYQIIFLKNSRDHCFQTTDIDRFDPQGTSVINILIASPTAQTNMLHNELLWQVEPIQGPRGTVVCVQYHVNSAQSDLIRLIWSIRKEIRQIDSVRIPLRGQVSRLYKRDYHVSL